MTILRCLPWLFLFPTLAYCQLGANGNGTPGSSPSIKNFQDAQFKNVVSATVLPQSTGGSGPTPTPTNGRIYNVTTGATKTNNLQLAVTTTGTIGAGTQNGTWASSNTAVATINSSGYVTYVAPGTATFTYTTTLPLYIAPYTYTFTSTGGQTVSIYLYWSATNPAAGLLPYDLNMEVDSLLTTAGTANLGSYGGGSHQYYSGGNVTMFSAINDSTQTYTRSTGGWWGSVDLSGISVWNNQPGIGRNVGCITLITPTDALSAAHATPTVGTVYYFVDNSNVTYTATIAAKTNISGTDLEICHLTWSGATPSTLAIYALLPSNYQNYCPDYKLNYFPIVMTNSYRQCFVQDSGNNGGSSFFNGSFYHNLATETLRSPYSIQIVSGDSSSPMFALINGNLVLIGTNYTATTCPSVADNETAINTALSGFAGDSYQLTIVPVSGFAATTNNGNVTSFPTY